MYCCCLKRFSCTSRNSQELKMFHSEPLVAPTIPLRHPKTKTTPELVASLLYEFVRHELCSKNHQRQTHFLGSDMSDEFSCLLCQTRKHSRYIQFEIDNHFFNNRWNGNQYIIQYVCFPCSKRLQSCLLKTIQHTEHDVRTMRFLLLLHKLSEKPHLIKRILAFLPTDVLTMKAITYHRSEKATYQRGDVEEDLSIWVQEKVIR